MTDIAEFLTARLDEDQAAAEAAASGSWPSWHTRGLQVDIDVDELDSPRAAADCYGRETAVHIARHDPARVLADITAKRRLLARHHVTGAKRDFPELNACDGCGSSGYGYGYRTPNINNCRELRDLASAFADHPDYDQSWSPA